MAKLAIKGHALRGKEVIQLLEMLGGWNYNHWDGKTSRILYFINGNTIEVKTIRHNTNIDEFNVFTLEQFEEKYPYKVGDKVILDEILCTITWMCWECNNIYYQVQGIGEVFTKKVTSDELKPFKEETMEDKDIIEPTTEINLNHPCFDGHNKIELIIPENWKFEQIDNKMFGIRKYPQYPKTYNECCDVIGISRHDVEIDLPQPYQEKMFNLFKLLICRDAYWKIAGDQMGLGKPWEPKWNFKNDYYHAIKTCKNEVLLVPTSDLEDCILAFPTQEMRYSFYKNFNDLIESCKKLL